MVARRGDLHIFREALISRTQKHTGAIKALQFNPHRSELIATCGTKGELYITDLNNASNPFRLGAAAARPDDIEALDWNKKVPHIMATASSGGFVTVWDVKDKKERLTLNNYGRKSVSAVAWDPDLPTKLATAVSLDQEPVILLWDLRNPSAPERILKGHEQGVLSLSWCGQDTDLLLSCGKDNRNICWNPHTGDVLGEFPIVTNWTFQTRWSPRQPTLLATASFDGKIVVQTLQNTNAKIDQSATDATTQVADGADFFSNPQIQPQASSFSLPKAPKWLKRPVGASFGFGGKLIKFTATEETPQKSKTEILTIAGDSTLESAITGFHTALKEDDLPQLCEAKVVEAQTDENKNDWKIIQTLVSETPRKGLLTYLGFSLSDSTVAGDDQTESSATAQTDAQTNGVKKDNSNRLSSFFDSNNLDNQDFLADLAASKGGRTNNPFQIFTGSESEADKKITRALMLGSFEEALDICLKESRMSEAFMIAICGGQKCIDKAQAAYFAQQANGPNYLRLLASVVGKNLWDIVYNADLENWSEVMATLCTYASETEFPDLCEALGDRLEENSSSRKDASFCYLAGSKLDKVVPIWIHEMQDAERSRSESAGDESAFSIHVQVLQSFIEKVSVFRKATRYEDKETQNKTSDWHLDPLYKIYAEYADVLSTYGQLTLAEDYLNLLPAQYPAAEVARNRVKRATATGSSATTQKNTPAIASVSSGYAPSVVRPRDSAQAQQMPLMAPAAQPAPAPYAPSNPYGPPSTFQSPYQQPSASPYAPTGGFGGAYQPPVQSIPPSEPPKPTAPPAARNANGTNWNDLPEMFKPPTSRRGTPGPATTITSPFVNTPDGSTAALPAGPPQSMQSRNVAPLPPPPKGFGPPQTSSPLIEQPPRPTSSAANAYAPIQPASTQSIPTPQPPMPRGPSPYNPPPSAAPPSNRYAPAPGSQSSAQPGLSGPPPGGRVIAPNPYMQPPAAQTPPPFRAQPGPPPAQGPPPRGPLPAARAPPPSTQGNAPPPPQGPPRGASVGPPPSGATPISRPSTAQSYTSSSGDRSNISIEDQPIFQILSTELQRIKGRAPANYKAHVEDTEKRFNLLFEQLNNRSIAPENITLLRDLAQTLQARDFDPAQEIFTRLTQQMGQSPPWMVLFPKFPPLCTPLIFLLGRLETFHQHEPGDACLKAASV